MFFVNVKVKLCNRKIKKGDEECDLVVDLHVTLPTDNHILSSVWRANGTISKIDRQFILKETNVVLKIFKTQINPRI